MNVQFNAIDYAQQLEAVGVPLAQAEVHAKMLSLALTSNTASRADLHALDEKLVTRMTTLKQRITTSMDLFEQRITTRVDKFQAEVSARMNKFEAVMSARMDKFEAKMELHFEKWRTTTS